MFQLNPTFLSVVGRGLSALIQPRYAFSTFSELKQIPGDGSIDRSGELFNQEDPFAFYDKLQAEYPNDSMVKFKFLNTEHVMSFNNDTARKILGLEARGLAIDVFPAHWGLLLGPKAISNLSGKEHLEIRKAYRPAFIHNAIAPLTPTVAKISMDTLEQIYTKCTETDDFIEVGPYCLRWQWNIGVQALFGSDFLSNQENEEMHSLFEVYVAAFVPSDGRGFEEGSMLWNGVQAYEKLKVFIRDNVIAKARQKYAEGTLSESSLIYRMLTTEGQPALTETETFCPLDSTLFLMFAAHHTTATGLAALFNNFAGNPQVVDRLNAELVEAFGEDIDMERGMDYDTLYQLKYLDATIRENLRITPPVPIGFRKATSDIELDEYEVKEGTIMYVPTGFYQNRVESWGENVKEFEPQRFMEKTEGFGVTYAPFSKANRLCIGMNLATLDLKMMAVAMATQKYKIVIDGDYYPYPPETKGQLLKNKIRIELK